MLSSRLFRICLILLSLSDFFSVAQASIFYEERYYGISQAMVQYVSTRDAVKTILQRYSYKTHIFIGLGKSPTPIMAMMQAISSDVEVYNLPLSNMRGFKPGGVNRYGKVQLYSIERLARLYEHFDHFLPQNLAGKRLVVIDFADTGATLDLAVKAIRHYYAIRYPEQATRVLALGIPETPMTEDFLLDKKYHILRVGRDLLRAMIYHQYKQLHEFEDFDLDELDLSKPYVKPPQRTFEYLQSKHNKDMPNQQPASNWIQWWENLFIANHSNGPQQGYDELIKAYNNKLTQDYWGLSNFQNLVPLKSNLKTIADRQSFAFSICNRILK